VAVDAMAALAADRALLDRASTAERVAAILRARIVRGELRPGTRLSEGAIAGALGVSRNTLREAFRLLAYEHLMIYEVNRAVRLRDLTTGDVADIYRVRLALESAGVRAVAEAPPERVDAVGEAVAAGERAAAADDWPAVGTADIYFHRALAGLTGSPRVDEYMDRLLAELRLAFHVMPSPHEFHEPYLRRNRIIANLVAARDAPAAEAELTDYLATAQREIIARMREVPQ